MASVIAFTAGFFDGSTVASLASFSIRLSNASASARASSSSNSSACATGSRPDSSAGTASSANSRSTTSRASISLSRPRNWAPSPPPEVALAIAGRSSNSSVAWTVLAEPSSRATRSSRSSGTAATPRLGSVVEYGWAAVWALNPVNALKIVVLPVLGNPRMPSLAIGPAG